MRSALSRTYRLVLLASVLFCTARVDRPAAPLEAPQADLLAQSWHCDAQHPSAATPRHLPPGVCADAALPTDEISPEDIAKAKKILIDGDIMTVHPDSEVAKIWARGNPGRQGMPFYGTTWSGGVVPYDFDASIGTSKRDAMRAAMDEWESVADLDFVPRVSESSYIHIIEAGGNWSYIGRIGGAQDLSIYNWNYKFIMCHELAHALGFWHEQSRPDRDTFVTIEWGNITSGYESNFNIQNLASTFGPYDFESIMHYDQYAFSTNWGVLRTITMKPGYEAYQNVIGNRSHFSAGDIQGMVAVYGAPGSAGTIQITAPNGGESWGMGSPATVTWNTSGTVGANVMIELSRNNGASWQTIFPTTPNDGSETWTSVLGPSAAQALVRITDLESSSITDVSDSTFEIHDSRVPIETALFLTRAAVRIKGGGRDRLALSGLYNDAGAGLGLDSGTSTFTVRDADQPASTWELSIPAAAWEQRGTRWSYRDKVSGIAVSIDTARHRLRLAAKNQSLPFAGAITLELLASFPAGLSGQWSWALAEGYRAGASQPLGAVFFITKGTIKRGKKSSSDRLQFEGYFRPAGGHDAPGSDPLDIDFGGLWGDSLAGGSLVPKGRVFSFRQAAPSGLTSVSIDPASGRFVIKARNIDLSGLSNSVQISLGLGDDLGRASLVLRGDPAVSLKL